MEDLNIEGMKKLFGKSISDASFGELVRQISYKSSWYGRVFHKISRWYPSSKTCSNCNHKQDKMDLSIREWICPKCNTNHDRDLNASINILHKGLQDLYDFSSAELTDYRHRENVRLKLEPVLEMPFSMKCLVNL